MASNKAVEKRKQEQLDRIEAKLDMLLGGEDSAKAPKAKEAKAPKAKEAK